MEAIFSLDYAVLKWIAEHLVCEPLTVLMRFVTSLGDGGMIWLLIALLLVLRPATRRCGWSMLAALLLSLIVGNGMLKPLFRRPRPFQQYADLIALIPPPGEYSFPSGHSSSSFAAATAFLLHDKKRGSVLLVLAGLIAFSRLYLCVHFPTDVLTGALLGVLLGCAGTKLVDWGAGKVSALRTKR